MTDNNLKIRIQIPPSSQPDDAAPHSIPDRPKAPQDTEKPPFDRQKIFITLFVVFLTISSFVYLVFIDENEPSPPATESLTTTKDSGQPLFSKRGTRTPIEDTTEILMEPLAVEEEIVTNVVSPITEDESFESPVIIQQHNVVESPETIAEIETTLQAVESLPDTSPGDQPQIVQAQLSSAIQQREPVDAIDHIQLKQGASARIHFYMKLRNLAGQKVSVHWYYKDQEMAKVNLDIGNREHWRTHSNKLLTKSRLGSWHVDLRDASGNLLAQRNFTVSSNP